MSDFSEAFAAVYQAAGDVSSLVEFRIGDGPLILIPRPVEDVGRDFELGVHRPERAAVAVLPFAEWREAYGGAATGYVGRVCWVGGREMRIESAREAEGMVVFDLVGGEGAP